MKIIGNIYYWYKGVVTVFHCELNKDHAMGLI